MSVALVPKRGKEALPRGSCMSTWEGNGSLRALIHADTALNAVVFADGGDLLNRDRLDGTHGNA